MASIYSQSQFVNRKRGILHCQGASNVNCSTVDFLPLMFAAFQIQSPTSYILIILSFLKIPYRFTLYTSSFITEKIFFYFADLCLKVEAVYLEAHSGSVGNYG